MTCAKEDDIFYQSKKIMIHVLFGVSLLWIITTAAVMTISGMFFKSRKKVRRSVYYDELLDIGNEKALEVYYNALTPEQTDRIYLSVINIDKFLEFNYIYGDENGEKLLKYIVDVFAEEVPEVTVFRYKSSNLVALADVQSQDHLEKLIAITQERFARDKENGVIQPFDTSSGLRKLDASLPIKQQINEALTALETIKGNHLRHHEFYDEKFSSKRAKFMQMESDLPLALKNNEFHVYYQPKYDMSTGKIIGAEALCRWIKSDGKIISPGEFIPCFEASSQICVLDKTMLEKVCRHMKEMQNEGIETVPVSVNLSRVHLRHPELLPNIMAIIKDSGVDTAKLSFEITESALLEESIPLSTIVDSLHKLGCKIDMDDYGVGASGPRALASNCFDVVKLDKSFIDAIGDKRVEDVIETTIGLAKRLGMEVLAEGVEERYQAEKLIMLGCLNAQGYYYSKPVPLSEYKKLLQGGENKAI